MAPDENDGLLTVDAFANQGTTDRFDCAFGCRND